jgi:hypothetical protein
LRYKGTGTITSVTVDTAVDLELITSDGGIDTYAFGTYTTLGTLVDAINKDGIFDAKILDALRSDASASKLVDGAITVSTVNGNSVYDVKVDTSEALHFSHRFCATRVPGVLANSDGKRIHLKLFKYAIDVGTAAADNVQVYKIRGTVEEKVWSEPSVDTTATTVLDWTTSNEAAITANPGEEILVRVKDAGTLADADTNYVQALALIEQSGLNM